MTTTKVQRAEASLKEHLTQWFTEFGKQLSYDGHLEDRELYRLLVRVWGTLESRWEDPAPLRLLNLASIEEDLDDPLKSVGTEHRQVLYTRAGVRGPVLSAPSNCGLQSLPNELLHTILLATRLRLNTHQDLRGFVGLLTVSQRFYPIVLAVLLSHPPKLKAMATFFGYWIPSMSLCSWGSKVKSLHVNIPIFGFLDSPLFFALFRTCTNIMDLFLSWEDAPSDDYEGDKIRMKLARLALNRLDKLTFLRLNIQYRSEVDKSALTTVFESCPSSLRCLDLEGMHCWYQSRQKWELEQLCDDVATMTERLCSLEYLRGSYRWIGAFADLAAGCKNRGLFLHLRSVSVANEGEDEKEYEVNGHIAGLSAPLPSIKGSLQVLQLPDDEEAMEGANEEFWSNLSDCSGIVSLQLPTCPPSIPPNVKTLRSCVDEIFVELSSTFKGQEEECLNNLQQLVSSNPQLQALHIFPSYRNGEYDNRERVAEYSPEKLEQLEELCERNEVQLIFGRNFL